MLGLCLCFMIPGILYIVFAFRPPPRAIEGFFRIPAIFIFFPERHRLKLGRIMIGALLTLVGLGEIFSELYHRIFGWS
jgi:hypothetical protein